MMDGIQNTEGIYGDLLRKELILIILKWSYSDLNEKESLS